MYTITITRSGSMIDVESKVYSGIIISHSVTISIKEVVYKSSKKYYCTCDECVFKDSKWHHQRIFHLLV